MTRRAPKTSYVGMHAKLYDLFYQDKPYGAEAEFVHDCIAKYGRGRTARILEIACGTGNHAFEFERLGYKVIATDNSKDMLSRAKEKAVSRRSSIDFRLADMRTLDLEEKPFDAVVCLFDSIGYVQTNEGMRDTLEGVSANLRSGGLFIFEFWHAAAMLRHYDPIRVRRWETSEGEVMRISETSVHYGNQLAEVAYSIYELRKDGSFSVVKETQWNRFFLSQDMTQWLSAAGLTPVKLFAGFAFNENIDDRTWHIVAVARRP